MEQTPLLPDDLLCWVVSDGTTGMMAQSLALAESLGISFFDMRMFPSPIYRMIPQMGAVPFMPISPIRADRKSGPPWPDLIISCGRRMVGTCLAIQRQNAGQTKLVHIQDPRVDPSYFDAMVVPMHDRISAENHSHIVPSLGSLNRLTMPKIAEAAANLQPEFASVRQPICAVMIGGNNKRYRPNEADFQRLAGQLAEHAKNTGAFLYLVPSRRTPKKGLKILSNALQGCAHGFWDGQNDNPYPGILGLADHIIVTSDSVNMVSEACITGKAVYVAELRAETGRIATFHQQMVAADHCRPLGDDFGDTAPVILDQTRQIAEKVAAILLA